MNIFKGNLFIPLVAFISLLVYAYNSIIYVGYLAGNSSWVAYSIVLFDLIAVYYILSSSKKPPKGRSISFAYAWIVWQFVLFFLLFRGGRSVLIFNALFAPLGYILFYCLSYKSEDNFNNSRILGIGLFLFCLFYSINVLLNGETYILGESTAASNLSYWPLCLFPFVFLVEKKILRLVLMILMVIVGLITVKRGAAIILFLVLIAYLYNNYFRTKHSSPWKFLVAILIIVGAYYAFNHFLGFYMELFSLRMGEMSEDQGSGRDVIYAKTIQAISNSGFFDTLFGHGCASFPQTGFSNAHNDLLQMMYEYGIIGTVFYLIMVFERISKLKFIRRNNDSLYMAYLTSIIILVVMGLVSNLVPSLTYFVFITSLWGLLEGKIKRESLVRYK